VVLESTGGCSPIDDDAFGRLMAPLGPFESAPVIAVAVSGGADSMCLALLTHRWAMTRGGHAVALTVDHGLRAESAAEAASVGAWLDERGICHHLLRWRDRPEAGAPGAGNLQARARRARYRLLASWCRGAGVLHLAVGHHRGDQAETVLMNMIRGSGVTGLAAMAAVAERWGVRILRPLLGVSRERLAVTLECWGQDWIEDPSNRDPAFARVAVRRALAAGAPPGLTEERLATTAMQLGRARTALDHAVAELLVGAAAIDPAGFCRLDRGQLAAAPEELALRALARVLGTIGGGEYPPRLARLTRLYRALRDDSLSGGRTLAGCRLLPRAGQVLVCRETAAADQVLDLGAGGTGFWDRRFRVALGARAIGGPFTVGRLGPDGWRAIKTERPELERDPLPAVVRHTLPALRDLDGVVALPHLTYWRGHTANNDRGAFSARFAPCRPLAGPEYRAAPAAPESEI
jgi:tRNA(Ile)-lysidine synthase